MFLIRSLLLVALAICATALLVKIVVVLALAGALAALALFALRLVRRLIISGGRRSVARGYYTRPLRRVTPLPKARISAR